MRRAICVLAAVSLAGCEGLLLDKDPANNAVECFELLWKTFDRNYYSFERKGVDWNAAYATYRPRVTEATTPQELYGVLFEMTALLKDVHVDIYQPYGPSGYDQTADYPANDPANAAKYVEAPQAAGKLTYGRIRSEDIGYVRIPDFEGDVDVFDLENENAQFRAIDAVLTALRDTRGIVIDVRSNDGGDDFNALVVARRFADTKRLFGYESYRKSENKSEFVSYARHVEPKGTAYRGPVFVLTNRRTSSAAEGFVNMMRVLPNVTTMGGNTGGGAGGPSFFELPNGWSYRLTTRMEYDADWNCYEGTGIPPDVEVTISAADSAKGVDAILEKAIERLR